MDAFGDRAPAAPSFLLSSSSSAASLFFLPLAVVGEVEGFLADLVEAGLVVVVDDVDASVVESSGSGVLPVAVAVEGGVVDLADDGLEAPSADWDRLAFEPAERGLDTLPPALLLLAVVAPLFVWREEVEAARWVEPPLCFTGGLTDLIFCELDW